MVAEAQTVETAADRSSEIRENLLNAWVDVCWFLLQAYRWLFSSLPGLAILLAILIGALWIAQNHSGGLPPPFYVAIATVVVSVFAASVAARINLKNKIMDCVMACNVRYDEIHKERSSIDESVFLEKNKGGIFQVNKQGKSNTKWTNLDIKITSNYYNRYWGLKSDQFDYWLSGYVDPETMCSWFYSVMKAFAKNPRVGAWSFSEGWEASAAYHRVADPMFDHLIDKLRELGEANVHNIDRAADDSAIAKKLYLMVIDQFKRTERQHDHTINFMTNIPMRTLIAPRQTMQAYEKDYRKERGRPSWQDRGPVS